MVGWFDIGRQCQQQKKSNQQKVANFGQLNVLCVKSCSVQTVEFLSACPCALEFVNLIWVLCEFFSCHY